MIVTAIDKSITIITIHQLSGNIPEKKLSTEPKKQRKAVLILLSHKIALLPKKITTATRKRNSCSSHRVCVSRTERYRYKTIDCVFDDPHEEKKTRRKITTYLDGSMRTVNRCTSLFLYTHRVVASLLHFSGTVFRYLSLFGLRKIWIFVHIKKLIRLFRFLLSFRSLFVGRDKSIRTKMSIYVAIAARHSIDAATDSYRALKNDKFRIRIAAYGCVWVQEATFVSSKSAHKHTRRRRCSAPTRLRHAGRI